MIIRGSQPEGYADPEHEPSPNVFARVFTLSSPLIVKEMLAKYFLLFICHRQSKMCSYCALSEVK